MAKQAVKIVHKRYAENSGDDFAIWLDGKKVTNPVRSYRLEAEATGRHTLLHLCLEVYDMEIEFEAETEVEVKQHD